MGDQPLLFERPLQDFCQYVVGIIVTLLGGALLGMVLFSSPSATGSYHINDFNTQ